MKKFLTGSFSTGILQVARCSCFIVLGLLSLGSAFAIPWLPFGPDGGDARRFAADPHDHAHLYLGTANGWLYESHDAGASWKRLSLIGKRDDLILDSIVVDPSDPKHVVIGTYSVDRPDGGLYITYDGGVSWTSQAEMRGQSIRSLSVAPSDPHIWVAGTLRGVYRSTDGARRWKQISPPDSTEIHEVESIAIDPKDPQVIYAGTWHLPWKTTDAGQNWANIKNGIIDDSDVFSIIIDPDAPKTVYASACSGIYKSVDAGSLFVKVQGIPSEARRTRVLLQDPAHLSTVFAGTTEGLFRSGDAGKLWSRTTGSDIIVNDVFVQPGDSQHVLIATDRGGVLASDDGGDTFRSSNSGFSARQITSLRRDTRHPATLFAGVVNDKEWGGVFQSDNGGLNWTQRSQGLAGRDVFSLGQAPDGTVIAGTSHGFFRLNDESETWTRVEDLPTITVAEAQSTGTPSPSAATRPPVPVGRNQFAKAQQAHHRNAGPGLKTPTPGSKTLKPGSHSLTASRTHSAAATTLVKRRVVPTPPKPRNVAVPHKKSITAQPAVSLSANARQTPTPAAAGSAFDGSVFSLVTSGSVIFATTSQGLLVSRDNGVSWQEAGQQGSENWRLMAAAKDQVVAASLESVFLSPDAGASWSRITLPPDFTRVSAVAVEPDGEIWVGGREGVFVSANKGQTWSTPKNLFLNSVNSLYFDENTNRILVTSASPSQLVFSVQLPEKSVTYTSVGWGMRFVRPVGDHLVAVTPYDGIVIQPKMVASPVQPPATAHR